MKKSEANRSKELNHDDTSNHHSSSDHRRTYEVGSVVRQEARFSPPQHVTPPSTTPHSRNTTMNERLTTITVKQIIKHAKKHLGFNSDLSHDEAYDILCEAQTQMLDRFTALHCLDNTLSEYVVPDPCELMDYCDNNFEMGDAEYAAFMWDAYCIRV